MLLVLSNNLIFEHNEPFYSTTNKECKFSNYAGPKGKEPWTVDLMFRQTQYANNAECMVLSFGFGPGIGPDVTANSMVEFEIFGTQFTEYSFWN